MAMILDAFAGRMVDRLAEFVEEKVVTILGVKNELKRLQRRMERIKRVLQDAERKRIQSKHIAGWVGELKDVVYDVDDIIDLCRFEGGKLLGDQPSKSSEPSTVRCNFSSMFSCFTGVRFRHEIGGTIKKLNERLDEICKETSVLNLLQNEPDAQITRVNPRQTSSVVDLSDIVGGEIQRASEDLIELIVKKDERRCRVIAVTGMGGIGKTTLAQKIFNHQKPQSEFSIKIWLCISQNFSETGLLKEMIRGAGRTHGDAESREELLTLLKTAVSGEHIFLVLDDVWRADVWVSLLRNPLQSGALTSRVLVTTRDRNVAMQMGAAHIHPIQLLSVESGWEMLCKCIFVDSGEEEMQSLRDVGIEIVEKCHGLPLAIKAIAGVLTTKERSRGEWERVLRRDAWSMDKLPEELRGALYLSYEDLPSHLKQCYLFFSLFAEDSRFSREDVVKYWVVEGFVDTQNDSFFEQSDDYFEELVRRNLIENAKVTIYKMYDLYKMHDLLRSLVQFLSGDESFCGEVHEFATISTAAKLRRLRITDRQLGAIPDPLLEQKKLRTMFLRGCPTNGNNLFVRFSFLRVLVLSVTEIECIPDALGNLIHLRLLDLHRTKVSGLPESIRNLTNLQVLNLRQCNSLRVLPDGITRLRNLWFLDLFRTPLSFMPAGMGRLEQLRIVTKFVVGENSISSGEGQEQGYGCSLEELKSLMQLRKLFVYNLENAVVAKKGQLVLRNKPHLKLLGLFGTDGYPEDTVEYTEEATHKIEEVLEELFPPPCLEVLSIVEYFGRGFPSWMMSSSLVIHLPQLRRLNLINCRGAEELPPLGLLPELRHLRISNASGVATIGPEFFGRSGAASVSFPKLETLEIVEMPKLQELLFCGEEGELIVLPRLQKLVVFRCEKLESIRRGRKQSPLEKSSIEDAGLESIPDWLKIRDCPLLICVEKMDGLRGR